jgi:hypothetical protein
MNSFCFIAPRIIVLRGIREKSISASQQFNNVHIAIMMDCEKNAVYNIRRRIFPELGKLLLMNNIQDYEHSFLKYEYFEKPGFDIFLPPGKEHPIFHNPYYTTNSTRHMSELQYEHIRLLCDLKHNYYVKFSPIEYD